MKMLIQKNIRLISGFAPAEEPVDADFFDEIAIDAERNEAAIRKIENSRGCSFLLADEEELESRYSAPKQRFFAFKDGILKEVVNAVFFSKKNKMLALEVYDKSLSVNSFILKRGYNTMALWLGSNLRIKLRSRLQIEKSGGATQTTLTIEGMALTLPVANALSFLNDLESYAIKCYDNTARHRQSIEQLQEVAAIKEYDFTTGYPEKVKIEVSD